MFKLLFFKKKNFKNIIELYLKRLRMRANSERIQHARMERRFVFNISSQKLSNEFF